MKKLFSSVRACFLLCLFLGLYHVVVLASLGPRFGDAMPQVVKGDGALAVAFGDARETISRAFVHKADGYFHGGIDMDCDHFGDHHHDDHDHDHVLEADHARAHVHEVGHDETSHAFRDPWAWINAHVRAPAVHVHLEGKQAVEMMPWFWASVKADPHNLDAWTTTWYIANNSMKDKELALRVVCEGLEKNPDDPELLVCRGRTLYDRGDGDITAAYASFSAAVDSATRMIAHSDGKERERLEWVMKFAKSYLAEIVKKGGAP